MTDKNNITDKELQHWQGLCDAATPGPWTFDKDEWDVFDAIGYVDNDAVRCEPTQRTEGDTLANNLLIAASREAMPRLIAEVQLLRGEIARRDLTRRRVLGHD